MLYTFVRAEALTEANRTKPKHEADALSRRPHELH